MGKLQDIEKEMNELFRERQPVIRGILCAALSKQHIMMIGPPGTGKSALIEDFCSRINGRYFRWLLSRTTAPEELFGPISLKALENDSYRRIPTGKLPEADIVFLDEIWKCNSAVLNSLLTALNERLFFNDGKPETIPLQFAAGASNELPEDREELAALWDRFSLRYMINYIRDPQNFERMLKGEAPTTRTTLTLEELAAEQQAAAAVDVSLILPLIFELREKIAALNIRVSDRKWKQVIKIIQANTHLNGRKQAVEDDLDILAAALWDEPGQEIQVRQAVLALANPYMQQAAELLDEAIEIYQTAKNASEDRAADIGRESLSKLKRINKKLAELQTEASLKGKDTEKIDAIASQCKEYQKEVVTKTLGIEL